VRTAFLTEWRGVDPDSIPRIASRAPRHALKAAPAKAHTYGGDCGCKPVYDVAKDRWAHRGPLPHVFEPTDGDAVTAEGRPTEDHQ
jgi:hypothetical protein